MPLSSSVSVPLPVSLRAAEDEMSIECSIPYVSNGDPSASMLLNGRKQTYKGTHGETTEIWMLYSARVVFGKI